MPDRTQSFKLVCAGGLNSNENHLDLAENKPGIATRLVNYEPSLFGGYRRLEGYDVFDAAYPEVGPGVTEGKVLCVAMFRNEGIGNPYVIAARKDVGADTYSFWKLTPLVGWEKLDTAPVRNYTASGLTVNRVRHTQFDFGAGGQIAFADGVNPAVLFDGTTWTEIAPGGVGGQALTSPKVIEVFENHLFASGDPGNSSVVAHSAPNNPADWTAASGAGQLTLGYPVVQIKPFRDNLFVFGSNSIKKVKADASAAFVSEQVTANVGCIAIDSVQEIGGDLVFLAPDGIRPVAGTSRIGDVELETISRPIQGRILDLIKFNDLDTLTAVVVRSKSQVRFFVGDDEYARIDGLGVLGGLTNKDGNISWEFSDMLGFRCSCTTSEYVDREEFVLHGDYDGRVYRQETGNTLAGDDMVGIYTTPYLDFGDTEIRKSLRRINTFVRAEGPFTANISISYDWGDQYTAKPNSYESVSTGSPTVWGGRNIEYGGAEVTYGGNNKPVMVNNVEGSGFSASLTFVSVGDYAPHTIQGLVLEFTVAGRN